MKSQEEWKKTEPWWRLRAKVLRKGKRVLALNVLFLMCFSTVFVLQMGVLFQTIEDGRAYKLIAFFCLVSIAFMYNSIKQINEILDSISLLKIQMKGFEDGKRSVDQSSK